MVYYVAGNIYGNDLYHHGIKGQKWGVRRYQNPDGSLTAAGLRRYGTVENFENAQKYKTAKKEYNKSFNKAYNRAAEPLMNITKKQRGKTANAMEDAYNKRQKLDEAKNAFRSTNKAARNTEASKQARSEHRKYMMDQGKRLAMVALSSSLALQVGLVATDKYANKGSRAVAAMFGVGNLAVATAAAKQYKDAKENRKR